MNPITVNHLTTKYDYADFKCAAAKAAIKNSDRIILRIVGSLLILAALILMGFFRGNFFQNGIYTAMGVVGVSIGCYCELIAYFVVRRRALGYFEANKEKFFAQITVFHEEQITFKTDRYSAAIPYDLLYKVYEDGRVFIIYIAINEMRFIPKRAVNEEEITQIRAILHTKLNEKYQQEGAR